MKGIVGVVMLLALVGVVCGQVCNPALPVFKQRNAWKQAMSGYWTQNLDIYGLNQATGRYDYTTSSVYYQYVVYDQARCSWNETQIWLLSPGVYAIQAYQMELESIIDNSLRDPQRYNVVSLTPPIPGSPDLRSDIALSIQQNPNSGAISFYNPITGFVDFEEQINVDIPQVSGDYNVASYQLVDIGGGVMVNVKVAIINFRSVGNAPTNTQPGAQPWSTCVKGILNAWKAGSIPLNPQYNSYIATC